MKPRGIAFAIESISNLPKVDSEVFTKLEKVVLRKVKELIPHYSVKILLAMSKA